MRSHYQINHIISWNLFYKLLSPIICIGCFSSILFISCDDNSHSSCLIEGSIFQNTGKAKVYIENKGQRFIDSLEICSDGRFSFHPIPSGHFILRIVANGYDTFSDNFTIRPHQFMYYKNKSKCRMKLTNKLNIRVPKNRAKKRQPKTTAALLVALSRRVAACLIPPKVTADSHQKDR